MTAYGKVAINAILPEVTHELTKHKGVILKDQGETDYERIGISYSLGDLISAEPDIQSLDIAPSRQ
jgi:hypothetical protein